MSKPETTEAYITRIKAELAIEAKLKEQARCLQVCRDFAKACYCQAEQRAQQGLYDDSKEFTERGKAAEAIARDIEEAP